MLATVGRTRNCVKRTLIFETVASANRTRRLYPMTVLLAAGRHPPSVNTSTSNASTRCPEAICSWSERQLARTASGGELSRVMLALRTVLSAEQGRKTLVFDEVDAGIGGKAAETVGKKLQELSARYQVLCVTHLAQIAAFADHQYCIEKLVLDGRTVTRVEALSGEARVEELVRMMSGSRVTEAARQHVKELLAGRS